MKVNWKRISTLIEEHGTTKAELARQLGVSKGYINHLQSGYRDVKPQTIYAIAYLLDVPVEELEEAEPVHG